MKNYAIIGYGSFPMPRAGQFDSIAEADAAVEEFRGKYGEQAGAFLAAGNVKLMELDVEKPDIAPVVIKEYR